MADTDTGSNTPIGENVVRAIEELRAARGLSIRQLAERLRELGHPLQTSAVHTITQGKRKVSPDELIALAVALSVDPVALLLPRHVGPDDVVELAPKVSQRARIAWGWMRGRWPLPADLWPDGVALSFPQTVFAEFAERTRPDFSQPLDDPAVAELVELQQIIEFVLGDPDPVARWAKVRDTVLRRFRLTAIQLEELFARLDGEGLAAGVFEFDADTAQREIRNATGWVRGPATDYVPEHHPRNLASRIVSGPASAVPVYPAELGTPEVDDPGTSRKLDPFGEQQ